MTQAGASFDSHHERVQRSVAAVRNQARRVWLLSCGVGVIGSAGVVLVAALLLDQMMMLPPAMRLVLLALVLAAPVVVIVLAFRHCPSGSLQKTALLIERRYPQLENLLINSLQLGASASADRVLVDEVAQEAETELQLVRPGAAVRKVWLGAALLAAAVTGAVLAIGAAKDTEKLEAGLNRVFVPFGDNAFTKLVDITPGDIDVLANSDVDVTVVCGGRVPTQATIECSFADGRTSRAGMTAPYPARPDHLAGVIANIEQDATYRIVAGDARSRTYRLRVHQRPIIEHLAQTVTPPAYIGSEHQQKQGGTIQALPGSRVRLNVTASEPIRQGSIAINDGPPQPLRIGSTGTTENAMGVAELVVDQAGRYRVEFTSVAGFAAEPVTYDILLLEDHLPQVVFIQPASDIEVPIDAKLVLQAQARDDFAVKELRIERITDGDKAQSVGVWDVKQRDQASVEGQLTVSVAELGLSQEKPVTLRAAAYDFRPDAEPGISDTITIRLKSASSASDESAADDGVTRVSLGELIEMQRTNLQATRLLVTTLSVPAVQGAKTLQEKIRTESLRIAAQEATGNPEVQRKLNALAATLMVVAVEQLGQSQFDASADTQEAILKALTAADDEQNQSAAEQASRRIAELLADMVARQKALREDTGAKVSAGAALSSRQRVLSRSLAMVSRLIATEAKTGAGGNADLASQYKRIDGLFEEKQVRQTMLIAAERLQSESLDDALVAEDKVLAVLLEAQQILRKAALDDAKEKIDQLKEDLADAKDRLDKLTELQRNVTEIARQLNETKDRRDGAEDQVELAKELGQVRQDIEDAIEQLVKDMHLFPPTDISNDLLMEMSEIYEDIKQKEGSENNEVTEMAVDRDEGVLAALKKMQEKMGERMGDLEMWLPDTPDSTRWKQESFDRKEMGEIPLGDLPDALEDIVGDLTDQAENLMKDAQDSASNVGLPDMTMGWDIMDGPMPSWAAKGKSGNQRPNEMEQIGRSGSGRQGMSSGEIVGDTIKALEGSDVQTRRTDDAFQAGELMEEDPGFMDVKATGGGKLAGITQTEGMVGSAPSRDLMKYRDMQRQQQQLKQHTEDVYSKAKLLRLPTGELDKALLELDAAQRRLESGDIQGYMRSQIEVIRTLKQTRGQLSGKVVIDSGDAAAALRDTAGATGEPIPAAYESAVADYMRSIAE